MILDFNTPFGASLLDKLAILKVILRSCRERLR